MARAQFKILITKAMIVLLLCKIAIAADEFGSLRNAICLAMQGTNLESAYVTLGNNSLVIDTNLVPKKELVRSLGRLLHRTDVRITNESDREIKKLSFHSKTYEDLKKTFRTFREDPATFEVRGKILATLTRLQLGGPDGSADREIVTEIFCARTSENGIPVFATADQGIYRALYQQTEYAQLLPEQDIIKQFYPRGFNVTLEGRTIRVIPVPVLGQ